MPIIASSGALTYSRTNLGDPNFTYWMMKPTGTTIGSVKDMRLDNANSIIYVQSTSSSGSPIICKINGFVAPTVGYNTTYTVSSPSGTYGLMGYMGYKSSTDELVVPFRYNRTYPLYGNYTVGSGTILFNSASTGVINNDYNRWPVTVPPAPSNNTTYTHCFSTTVNSSGETYTAFLEADPGNYDLLVKRYDNLANVDNGGYVVGPSPATRNANNQFGRLILDSSQNSIVEVRIYGSTSNEIRWYTNSPTAGGLRQLPMLYSIAFNVTSKRLQLGGITLDSSENRVGAIYNQTDNQSYVVKTSPTQTFTWQKRIYGVTLTCVATDSNDNIYAVGNIGTAIYIIKFDSSGNMVWERQISSSTSFGTPNIYCDSADDIYISALNNTLPFIIKLPNDGTKTGSYILAGATITYSTTSASIDNGNLVTSTPVSTSPPFWDLPYNQTISTTATNNGTGRDRTPVS